MAKPVIDPGAKRIMVWMAAAAAACLVLAFMTMPARAQESTVWVATGPMCNTPVQVGELIALQGRGEDMYKAIQLINAKFGAASCVYGTVALVRAKQSVRVQSRLGDIVIYDVVVFAYKLPGGGQAIPPLAQWTYEAHLGLDL